MHHRRQRGGECGRTALPQVRRDAQPCPGAHRVVLPDGSVIALGSAGGERWGYDLFGAFVGSEGCFGVATRSHRAPDAQSAARCARCWRTFLHRSGGRWRSGLRDHRRRDRSRRTGDDGPAAICARWRRPSTPQDIRCDAAAVLLIELDGLRDAGRRSRRRARRGELCMDARGARCALAQTDAERASLWQGRKKAFGAMGRIARTSWCRTPWCRVTRCPTCSRRSRRSPNAMA